MRLLLPLVLLNLTACNLVPPPEPSVPTDAPKAAMAPYTVNEYVANLTSQLNHVNSALNANARIGVSSFFYADALDTKLVAGQASGLSLQIQESLLTQFTQLGYHTVEYRLGNNLILAQNADSILSRDLSKLRNRQNIDLVITGTVTRQQHAYIVNARLVNIENKQVLSAGSTEIPINVMWGNEKIQQRDGSLYRSEY
ncbi:MULTISPECIES: FlgO family outer membrane protein [unclassified Pseudoalteromonas]|jgi:TolB-like protein|uniref:FlgO family outer membrane protein n=1 Tax=unclassified Pseudoalteromonas TaxID=194690 RepID=UPI00235A38D3|nr:MULTISPECIES: FlgO family outer membrane protein [unclassified Pseudoalteromonas]MDC9563904.1 FlgO family outer membrane protein [Pseudoalteromonas sp. GAB2316C]MDC9568294.1 FlgO family outer membrane protein [Pseudoalteromonas sp. GABNB9D]MDC9572706.1 FlgO family outer membrane protein [Pseudoalteromonas sp. GABNS16A]MDC9576856.1 FlgO family outer membrane protein [Pseudoalteromonas sp. GABNS16E]MDC9584280.1 FlgO family outer membrane protein [Pseudoalteromonas sp. GABNS16C]